MGWAAAPPADCMPHARLAESRSTHGFCFGERFRQGPRREASTSVQRALPRRAAPRLSTVYPQVIPSHHLVIVPLKAQSLYSEQTIASHLHYWPCATELPGDFHESGSCQFNVPTWGTDCHSDAGIARDMRNSRSTRLHVCCLQQEMR